MFSAIKAKLSIFTSYTADMDRSNRNCCNCCDKGGKCSFCLMASQFKQYICSYPEVGLLTPEWKVSGN